jgi:S1-C subfamily serine protease
LTQVSVVDLIALLIVGVAMYFGWRSGFVVQATALAGFIGGLALVIVLAPFAADALAGADPWLRSLIAISAVAAIVLVSQAIGSSLGARLRRRIGRGILGGVDMGAGAAFGFVRGLFVVWLMGGLLTALPNAALATQARQSLVLRALDTRLPSPLVFAAELGRLVEAAGFPDVFVGAPPATDIPVGGPSAQEAEKMAAAARASTLRVEAVACGNLVSGTSFAVSDDLFVTNAHVVAGASDVWLSFDGSLDRYVARVVMFDPQLDAALLAVDRHLDVAPLMLNSDPPGRGDEGVALGFTGGGRLRVIPVVVSRSLEALGRDIYDSGISAREVIEMRADVAPGDSGGPVVFADGTVGGVTFSESRDQPEIGYALEAHDVSQAISGDLGSDTAVSTGDCIHEGR